MGLTGFVCNGPEGVDIEVEGRDLDGFIEQLRRTLPPLARIDSLIESPLAPCGDGEFGIAETRGGEVAVNFLRKQESHHMGLIDLVDDTVTFYP